MKLYYSAGSCSTSCHITLEESGLKYEAVEVDWDNASDPNVALVTKLNPLGTLPVFVTDDGNQLDQNVAIHTYVADKANQKTLLPAFGTYERAEVMNWLSFVSSDLHKSLGALFSTKAFSTVLSEQEAYRKFYVEKTKGYLSYMDSKLAGKKFLTGDQFTVADAYAFIVVGWTQWLEVPMTPYTHLKKFMEHVTARPAVAKVLKEEGLS